MAPRRKMLRNLIYIVELGLVYLASSLVRGWFDVATRAISPVWLVTVLKILLFAAIIIVTIIVALQLDRFLKARGIIE